MMGVHVSSCFGGGIRGPLMWPHGCVCKQTPHLGGDTNRHGSCRVSGATRRAHRVCVSHGRERQGDRRTNTHSRTCEPVVAELVRFVEAPHVGCTGAQRHTRQCQQGCICVCNSSSSSSTQASMCITCKHPVHEGHRGVAVVVLLSAQINLRGVVRLLVLVMLWRVIGGVEKCVARGRGQAHQPELLTPHFLQLPKVIPSKPSFNSFVWFSKCIHCA